MSGFKLTWRLGPPPWLVTQVDGTEISLSCFREGKQLCISLPPIGAWEIATILVF